MDAPELDALIDGYADGLLDEVATARLAGALRGDAAARRRFWERQRLHAQLAAAARAAAGSARARPRPRWPTWAAAAALVAVLAGTWLAWVPADLPQGLAAGQAVAGPRALAWSDGTRVELQAGARAVVLDARRGPALRLDAGALAAAVAPHPAEHPFAIATPAATATVVGTGFRLDATSDTTALWVEHGRVRLGNAAGTVEAGAGASAMASSGAAPHLIGRSLAVAPDGDDAAAGDATHPWRSLARAAAALEAGDTLTLRGTWRETLILDRPGRWAAPITVRSAGALIDGGDPLPAWTRGGDGLWRAQAPWTLATAAEPVGADQLLLDGEPAPLAAWPDAPGLATASAGGILGSDGGTARARLAAAGIPGLDLAGAVVWWLPADGTAPDCGRLLRADTGAVEFLCDPRPADPDHRPSALSRFRILGVPALADRPGEWCRDGAGGVLLRLADDDTPQHHQPALQRRRDGVVVRATAIRLEGLSLLACDLTGSPDGTAGLTVRHARAGLWPRP